MAVLTITTNYDGHIFYNASSGAYTKYDTLETFSVGCGEKDPSYKYRSYLRFSLADLPLDATISQVRLYVYITKAGASTHLTDIRAYGSNGQDNPQEDTGATLWNRCASGNLYVNDSTQFRTTGDKWLVLGGSIAQDILAAKASVNRFSLALHEEGDNDAVATGATLENTSYPFPAKLEITYTVPVAAVALLVGDGLSQGVVYAG